MGPSDQLTYPNLSVFHSLSWFPGFLCEPQVVVVVVPPFGTHPLYQGTEHHFHTEQGSKCQVLWTTHSLWQLLSSAGVVVGRQPQIVCKQRDEAVVTINVYLQKQVAGSVLACRLQFACPWSGVKEMRKLLRSFAIAGWCLVIMRLFIQAFIHQTLTEQPATVPGSVTRVWETAESRIHKDPSFTELTVQQGAARRLLWRETSAKKTVMAGTSNGD